jgi:hypothetical protein
VRLETAAQSSSCGLIDARARLVLGRQFTTF